MSAILHPRAGSDSNLNPLFYCPTFMFSAAWTFKVMDCM